jgi:hypothetical protein
MAVSSSRVKKRKQKANEDRCRNDPIHGVGLLYSSTSLERVELDDVKTTRPCTSTSVLIKVNRCEAAQAGNM